MWGDKRNALLSGVAPATRQRYLSAWNQWAYFASMRNHPARLVKTHPNWDGDLVDFIMLEARVAKNTSDSTHVKISAIRFRHVISGLDDFTKYGGRYQQVLKGMKRDHMATRKIPFSLDMLEWIYTDFLQNDLSDVFRVELYTSAVLGFFFLLRIGELENLMMSDWVGAIIKMVRLQ